MFILLLIFENLECQKIDSLVKNCQFIDVTTPLDQNAPIYSDNPLTVTECILNKSVGGSCGVE